MCNRTGVSVRELLFRLVSCWNMDDDWMHWCKRALSPIPEKTFFVPLYNSANWTWIAWFYRLFYFFFCRLLPLKRHLFIFFIFGLLPALTSARHRYNRGPRASHIALFPLWFESFNNASLAVIWGAFLYIHRRLSSEKEVLHVRLIYGVSDFIFYDFRPMLLWCSCEHYSACVVGTNFRCNGLPPYIAGWYFLHLDQRWLFLNTARHLLYRSSIISLSAWLWNQKTKKKWQYYETLSDLQ